MSSASAHHVGEDVRDVDHRLAGRAQPPDEREQPLGLARGQRRRRLVEDDDAAHRAAAPWRPRPVAARPATGGRPAYPAARSRLDLAEAARAFAAASALRSISANGPKRRRGKPSRKMFSAMVRLVKRLSSWWMKAMPLRVGVAGIGAAHRAAPSRCIAAGIRLHDAADDVHQRRLAGAVLADQAEHAAAAESRLTSRTAWMPKKALRYPVELEDRVAHAAPSRARSRCARRRAPRRRG